MSLAIRLPRLRGTGKRPDDGRVAALEAQVVELEAGKQRLSDEANDYACAIVQLTNEVDDARTEVEQLRGELRAERAARQVERDHRLRVEDAARRLQAGLVLATATAIPADGDFADPARWRAHILTSHRGGDSKEVA